MSMAKPPEAQRELLIKLCADPRNLVFVISGREKEEMEDSLGEMKVRLRAGAVVNVGDVVWRNFGAAGVAILVGGR